MLRRTFTAVVATAAAVTSLVCTAASSAATTPVALSFDHLVLETPGTGLVQIVTPSTQPLSLLAQVDPSNGDFSVDPSTFTAPTDSLSTPAVGTATLALANTATGNLNPSTGAVTLHGDFLATLDIPSLGGDCTVNTGNLSLSTSATEPLTGTLFPTGASGVATGDGALGAGWRHLNPGTGPSCATVDPDIDNGAGGLWISRGIDPATATPAAPARISVSAATPRPVVAGKPASVKVTLTNTGGPATVSVKVCLAAERPLSASGCQTVSKPGAKVIETVTFTVTTTRTTKVGRHLLTLTATGQQNRTLTLRVTRAAKARPEPDVS